MKASPQKESPSKFNAAQAELANLVKEQDRAENCSKAKLADAVMVVDDNPVNDKALENLVSQGSKGQELEMSQSVL